jgi:hypothetical protein
LPRVKPDERQQEDDDHPGLPFQLNSAHSPNYVTHRIQDGSGGLHVPKYVAFMYSMRYPQIMGTMGWGKLNFNWPLQARPAPGSTFYPRPCLTQCKINIFLEDGGDGGFYNIVDDTLKMLDDPYLSAEVEFLRQTDHDLEMEANELEVVRRQLEDVKNKVRFHQWRLAVFSGDRYNSVGRLSAADAYNHIYPYLTSIHAPTDTPESSYINYCPSSALRSALLTAGPGTSLARPTAYSMLPPHATLRAQLSFHPYFLSHDFTSMNWSDSNQYDPGSAQGSV